MTKYYIDTSLTGVINASQTVTDDDGTYKEASYYYFDYAILIKRRDSTFWSNFCEDVLIDGEDISYLKNIKDDTYQIIIPARTTIENYGSKTFKYCKAVAYQTD